MVLCQLDSMKPCIAVKDISFRQLKSVDMDTLRADLMRSELCTNVFPSLDDGLLRAVINISSCSEKRYK